MVNEETFNIIKPSHHMSVAVDTSGDFGKAFPYPKPMPSYLFILCTQGTCQLSTLLASYTLTANSFITILPNNYIHVLNQSPDCTLYITTYQQGLLINTPSFSAVMSCIECILVSPTLSLEPAVSHFVKEYILLLQKSIQHFGPTISPSLAATQLLTIFHAIHSYYETNAPKNQFNNRGEEIIKGLTKLVIRHYRQERNVTFYANLLHITPQHLSTTVHKVTGKTATDIIAKFVITDASSKLRSTKMSIQEIAYSLNFSDISFFGKYFKRYTGVSPRQYREGIEKG